MNTGVSTSPRRVCRTPARALLEESVLRRVKGDKGLLTGMKGIKGMVEGIKIWNS
jgi:hypothetical protein